MFKQITITSLLILSTLIFISDASAQTTTPKPSERGKTADEIRERREQVKDQLKVQRENMQDEMKSAKASAMNNLKTVKASAKAEITEKLCERVTERVKSVSQRYESNHNGALQKYQNLKTRMQKIVTDLKSKGANTASLETAISGLDQKISAITTAHQEYLKALESTKQYGCGTSDGAYKEALQTSKAKLDLVRKSVIDTRVYYQESVRPEIIKLRLQLNSARPKSTSSSIPRPTAKNSSAPVATSSPSGN